MIMTVALGGKVALVTGGSRGIGATIALRLAQDGANVALTYQHSADEATTVVDQITRVHHVAGHGHDQTEGPHANNGIDHRLHARARRNVRGGSAVPGCWRTR